MTRINMLLMAAASTLTLVACQSSSTVAEADLGASKPADGREVVVVTGNKREASAQDSAQSVPGVTSEQAYAPPPPPPPPMVAPPAPRMMAPVAGFVAQPMPGEINRDKYDDVEINGVKVVAKEPVSTFSIDVDTASYTNVRRMLNAGHLPPKDAVRIEEMINYFDYEYALPKSKETPFETTVKVVPSPWSEGRQLMHVAVQGYDISKDVRPPLNLTLLVDVSGSMSGPDRLPLAIKSLKMLIDELGEKDKVSIVVYAGAAGAVLEPTSGADKGKILAALDRLSAGGSTAGGEGLRLAYSLAKQNFNKNGVNRVILLSDGDFNVGISNPEQLEDFVSRERESGVYLSILGFGGGNYNDAMMQKLAQSGNGMAAYIDNLNEGRKVLNDDLSGSMFSIANDVKIQVEFNPAAVAEYRLIGYETRLLDKDDFNNDKVDAGEIGAGHTVTALYEVTPKGSQGQLVDPLRYGTAEQPGSPAGEYAFVKIRYKLPGEDKSRLITQPVTAVDEKPDSEASFAAAVAAFGQLLRGGEFTGTYGFDDVVALATANRGPDPFGYRAEFINLVRLAKSARSMQ